MSECSPSVLWCLIGSLTMIPSRLLAAPTFQELMAPAMFPEAQWGMKVDSAHLDDGAWTVTTTGARFRIDLSSGEVSCEQRIGHQREVAGLSLGVSLSGVEMTHSGPGFARLTCAQPKLTVRINGDSLFMLHAEEALTVAVQRRIEPAWHSSFENNHLVADEWGAFGLYCSVREPRDRYDAYAATVATYRLPTDAVLWVAVCPPKAYDWERSLKDNVVWHWSRTLGYPADETLRSWRPHGNIILLQSEVMLWKDWNLDFAPRLGAAEFARVRDTVHRLGMRFIVYTSPYYFLRGTPLESRAINSFENFKGWPPGTPTGENMHLFLPAIERVMKQYRPDGLYFDGQYTRNPAALYALARRAREIVGEQGLLEWHSTTALGNRDCYLPPADAYIDFILRGEGRQARYADFDYLRFFVSGYNISNSIGVLCNNAGGKPTPPLIGDVLRANARLHTLVGWLRDEKLMQVVQDEYRARLTPALREQVDRQVDARQAEVAAKASAVRAERESLQKAPPWGKPAFSVEFTSMPEAEQFVSPVNDAPFRIADGCLRTRGHANTYAFLRLPLTTRATGFVVKIRHGSEGGQSWGPGAMLHFTNGASIRLGTRSDGTLQADIAGAQSHGATLRIDQWVWLRARWQSHLGVVERSDDGVTYHRVWTFEHGGAFNQPTTHLSVGKVPYNGQPSDYSIPGAIGQCDIDFVRVYGH